MLLLYLERSADSGSSECVLVVWVAPRGEHHHLQCKKNNRGLCILLSESSDERVDEKVQEYYMHRRYIHICIIYEAS